MNKAKSETIHARKRAKKRYHFDFDNDRLNEIVRKIQNGKSKPIKKESNARTIHDVAINTPCGDKIVRVVYSKTNKTIITFLHRKERKEDSELYNQ